MSKRAIGWGALAAGLLLVTSSGATDQEPAKGDGRSQPGSEAESPATPAAASPVAAQKSTEPASTAAEPIERQPYRIIFHFACHPSSRIDSARRVDLLRDWQVMVRRFVGAPWLVTVAPPSGPVLDIDLEGLEKATPAQAAAFEKAVSAGSYDKVWVVHADRSDSGIGVVLTGREYDTATRRLGPFQRRTVEVLADGPRALLEFTLDLFSPTAVINGQDGGQALLTVRGSAIEPASPIGRVVSPGAVLQPIRLISTKDRKTIVRIIPWTYLRVESVDGPTARCAIVSGRRDPLTQRILQPNTLAAVGIKPGKSPLRLRFVTLNEKAPGAGYTLTGRPAPNGTTRELGMTDRGGRIVLKPGFADGLVILRLLAGSIEPVAEFPVMPGETSEERTIPFQPKYECVALETEVDSLRDEVVDLIALRARLEARMKVRLEGEDWDGLAEALKEASHLPPRDDYAKGLAALKERATKEQAETKKAILTKNAQAQINDVQAMIDRYLDDDVLRAYQEALDRGKAEAGDKAKVAAKAATAKAAPAPVRIPRAEPVAAAPAPAEPPKAQPKPSPPPAGGGAVPF
jgi:hypothetical protein